jgi:phosphate transport system ATP-binding protein
VEAIRTKIEVAGAGLRPVVGERQAVFEARDVSVFYGDQLAIDNVNIDIYQHLITAIIGPSGCGKSTFIRTLNRMTDLVPSARLTGELRYRGIDLYGPRVDAVEVRRRIGMVFQKPNPFPKSIYDNVAYGLRILGLKKDLDESVEKALRAAALWDEARALGRTTATTLYCSRDRRRARGHPARRARLGARPDCHLGDRGPDA